MDYAETSSFDAGSHLTTGTWRRGLDRDDRTTLDAVRAAPDDRPAAKLRGAAQAWVSPPAARAPAPKPNPARTAAVASRIELTTRARPPHLPANEVPSLARLGVTPAAITRVPYAAA